MPVETELKLRIAPEHLARLKRHALFRSLSFTRPVTRRLYNIYYDTPKLELHKAEMALRLRRAGKQWLQTLKGGGSVQGGLHRRNEWEVPVSGPALDFALPDMADWDAHLPPPLRKKLHPVFVTDFSRSSRLLRYQDAEIELCIDQGQVSTEQHSVDLCELELELKSGEPRRLFELALAILDIAPFELESVSKAEQGYRLLQGLETRPVKAALPGFGKDAILPEVLQGLVWSCLQHWQANLRGAMERDDDEYLHQLRVALRRLRVVLRMAERIHPDDELAALGREVAALCIALGQIREWDVFIAQTASPMCVRMPGHAGLQALLAACEKSRADSYAALRSAAQRRAMQQLLLRISLWMSGGYWQRQEALPVRGFATRHLGKLSKKFVRSAKQLEGLDAARLHALRIVAKKLRYSAEFFSSVYGDRRRTKAFLDALAGVQDVLGQINDVAVAHRLLDELAQAAALAGHQEAIALAKGWIAHDLSGQFAALHKAVQRFNRQDTFWGK